MGLWVYEIAPCPGRCGVTGGGRLPLVVVDCGAPGHLAVLAGRQRIVMTVRGNNAHVAANLAHVNPGRSCRAGVTAGSWLFARVGR